jgi:hypothetical protein
MESLISIYLDKNKSLDFHRKAFLILLSTFAKGIRAIILYTRA